MPFWKSNGVALKVFIDDGSAVLLKLEDSEIEARRNAIEKLTKYRDEHFGTEQKAVSTEKKSEKAAKQPLSTEQKLEKTIENLEKYKKLLENGDMEKLEHQNPDRYGEIIYRLERMLSDEHDSDYLGDVDDVSVLTGKYKGKLEMLKAENAKTEAKDEAEKSGAQKIAGGIFDESIGTKEKPATQEDVNSYVEYALEYGDKKRNAEAAGSIIVNKGFDGAVEYFLEQAPRKNRMIFEFILLFS